MLAGSAIFRGNLRIDAGIVSSKLEPGVDTRVTLYKYLVVEEIV
jgi:hypothetical protein